MSNEEEKRCPLCAEEMDWTDQQLKPCKCGYEVCVWCWHHIMDMAEKDATEGRCPACRAPYDKDRIVGLESNFQRVAANSSSRKQKPPKAKPKQSEARKDLSNVRVIQRRMAYIIGLPLSLADEDLLQRKDYFGQYGKVTKVSLSRTAGGTVQQFVNDTCSVYITYSKEEEAVRCIQSVHGYELEGRFLRASFGTAKYCHAWLRNMPCNNPACLYLHSIGAEEDSFGKDEVAAVHTRNRVQEIVGATQYLHRRSGSMLPPPVVDHTTNRGSSSEEPVSSSGPKDVVYAAVTSGDQVHSSKDKDGAVRSSKQMTTFVDIVGRSSNSPSDKDTNSFEEARMLNLCSDMSSIGIDKSNHVKNESSEFVNGVSRSKLYSEPFIEASKPHSVEKADLILDSRRQLLHSNIVIEDSPTSSNDQRSKDYIESNHTPLIPCYPAMETNKYGNHAWWDTDDTVNNHGDEALIQSSCMNSVFNDGYNEKKFQNSAKSDRIYRGSNSFSNEEIVEHLRRLDDDIQANNDENSAAVESSIISNILSMDLDGCDDSTLPQTVAGLFEGKDGRQGSSWHFQNSDQSRFSFANEQGFSSQQNDFDSPFSNIGQELTKYSVLQDYVENKDYLYKPQYQASRAHNLTPPGFSVPSKPPPGFSSCMRTEQPLSATSGSHLMGNNHYRSPSIGNLSNSSDDLVDPAIMVVGRGKSSTNTFNNFDTRSSSFSSQHSTSFDDETKLWLLMQQQQNHHHRQEPLFSQTSMQNHQFPSPCEDFYSGLSSRITDQHHQTPIFSSYNTQHPQYLNGQISNGYHNQNHQQQQHQMQLEEAQQHNSRNEMEQIQRNERLGFGNVLPGYGDYMFQKPSQGDVYTRVFGM